MIVVCCRSGIELWRHNRQDKSHQTIRKRRGEKKGGIFFLIFWEIVERKHGVTSSARQGTHSKRVDTTHEEIERARARERERERERKHAKLHEKGAKRLWMCAHISNTPGRANAAVELMAKLDLLLLKSITAFVSLLFFSSSSVPE